jgi:hypothetical protein
MSKKEYNPKNYKDRNNFIMRLLVFIFIRARRKQLTLYIIFKTFVKS